MMATVIAGVDVYDGSGGAAFRADVEIGDGIIARVAAAAASPRRARSTGGAWRSHPGSSTRIRTTIWS
ncbi:hypothetical protein QTN93_19165 [Sphingomonas aerolata]|uniref:hypothetical protein n=1 Tax=Sphingomonas aerolata TaxID=185951 RepID=UPI0035A61CC1